MKAQRANGLIDTFTGTGFIVHPAGYVLTCNHVVPADMSAYTKIEQTGSVGGRYDYPYPLTIIRRDQQADVMLLKLPAKDWRSVKSGAEAQVGSDITALGFPLDQDLVAAPGSITGTDHDGRWLTNANLIPGMSGGPAFDRSGAVIGIVAGGYEEARSLDLLIPITFSTSLLQYVSSPLLPLGITSAPRPTPNPHPTSTPTPGPLTEASIKRFIQSHLKTVENRQLDDYMSAYDDYVVWYGEGSVSSNKIRQEMRSYLNSWDTITYRVTGPVQIHTSPDSRGVHVSYPIELYATNQQTGKHRRRVGMEAVVIEVVNGNLKIVSENQRFQ